MNSQSSIKSHNLQRPRIRVIKLNSSLRNRRIQSSKPGTTTKTPTKKLTPRIAATITSSSKRSKVIEKLVSAIPKLASATPAAQTSSTDSLKTATQLLSDIKAIFKLKKASELRTQTILDVLCADKKKPWATYNKGDKIGARQLALLLKQFGIRPRDVRFTAGAFKGYRLEWFSDAAATPTKRSQRRTS